MSLSLQKVKMSEKTIKYYIKVRKALWEQSHDIEQDNEFRETVAAEIKLEDDRGRPVNPHLMNELNAHPELAIELLFVICTKETREIVPFFFNKVQKHIMERINKATVDYKLGKRNSLKFRCLKGRQQGVTALITAYQLAHLLFKLNFSGFTMANTDQNAAVILNDKAKFPYRNIPKILKAHAQNDAKEEIYLDLMNSSWRIGTAKSGQAGRSRTIAFLHLSETGFFENYPETITAIKPACPKNAIIFEESTAHGRNSFYDAWFDKESDYENIFIEWWLSDEYRLPFESPEIATEFKKEVNDEVSELHQKLKTLRQSKGLHWNQLYWYFTEKKTQKNKMYQEYPCVEEEAFLFTGENVFDTDLLNRHILELADVKPIKTEENGQVTIFEEPIKGEKYFIGADPADGFTTSDNTHAKIYRENKGGLKDGEIELPRYEEVAFIHGKINTDKFGHMLVKYAKRYNNAFIGIENNNMGRAVINTVWLYADNGMGYKNIFQQWQLNRKFDKPEKGKKLGWNTSESSKRIMISELKDALEDGSILIRDINFYKEAHAVVEDKNNVIELTGKDVVAAACIGYQMRKYHRKRNAFFDHIQNRAAEVREKVVYIRTMDNRQYFGR